MGKYQSFERLHERGGFGYTEVISLLADLIERERSEFADKLNAVEGDIREITEWMSYDD